MISEVLKEYGIKPHYVEKLGNIYKVYSQNKTYALKRVKSKDVRNFFPYYQFLYQKGYYRFVPIYPTNQGTTAVLKGQDLYYLMPWFSNQQSEPEKDRAKKMFRELARLHSITKREVEIEKELIEEHYERMRLEWQKELEFLNSWFAQCERKWYMSPFEWEFVQYFNEIQKAYEFVFNSLEKWKNQLQEKQKIRTVLVHGKIHPDHFIYDNQGYGHFINFEKATFSSPLHDLLPYLVRSLKTYPNQCNDCIEWILQYFKHYPISPEEKLLFKSYLAHPGHFIKIVSKYQSQNMRANRELYFTKKLQHTYWMFKNIEYIVMRLEDIERQQQMMQQNQNAEN